MSTGLKNTLVVILAIIVGGIAIYMFEIFATNISNQQLSDHNLIKDNPKYLVLILLAHAIGGIVTGWLIGKFTAQQDNFLVLLAGLFWTIIGVANIVSFEHPVWFAIADTCIYLPMVVIGRKIADLSK
jgi:CBS domain containing-hemolysin-like protein